MSRTFTSSVLPPHDRGLELGDHLAGEIAATVAGYRRLFATVADGFDVDLWGERAWVSIQRLAPEAAAEIAGIATGAGRPVREIAALNARTELLAAARATGVTECSAVVALPPGRAPVAVQTWDWYDAMAAAWLTWTVPHPDGRSLTTLTEVGMLAKIGVNDRGVGVLLTLLRHRHDARADRDEVGYPVHLLARKVLDDAASTAEAMDLLSAAVPSASSSLTVVDDRGGAASVELFPGGPGVVRPVGGVLARTNHFVSDAGRDGCQASTVGVSTEVRRDHLLSAFAAGPPQDEAEVLAAMRHHHLDGGVCRHPAPGDDARLRHRTLATVTLDLAGRRVGVRTDGPCAGGVEVRLPAGPGAATPAGGPSQEPPAAGTEADRVLAALAPVSAAIAAGGYAALLRGGLGSGMLRHCLVPVTPAALAAVLGLAEQTTSDLCVAMTTHGILVGDGQTYRTADAVAPLLDLGAPAYVEDLLRAGATRDRLVTQLLSPDRSPGRASPSRPPRGYWAAAPEEQAALAAGVTLPPGTVLARTLIGSTFDAVPEVSAVLATGGRYLELGCGVGGVLLTLLGMFPRMTAVAVDLSGVLLDRARASALQLGVADRVRLVHGDATRLREPEPFDVVFWSQFYFPTATRHDALVTATTSLRPGGYLLAPLQDEPSVLVDEPTSAQARQAALDRLLHGSWGVPARSGQELVAELAAEGLVGARVVDSGSARLVLARRP